MGALPFVLEHGAWISRAAIAAIVATPITATLVIRRLRARRAAREKLAVIERHADHVRGTLRGGGLLTLEAKVSEYAGLLPEDMGPPSIVVSHTTGDLWLDTKDGRVNLDGPLEIVVGSHVHSRRGGVPRETPPELLAKAQTSSKWVTRPGEATRYATELAILRVLRQGDDVVATGIAESVASSTPDTGGYRDNAASMQLRAVADDKPIRIAAQSPVTEAPRTSIVGVAVAAAVLLLVGYGFSYQLGKHWLEECGDSARKDNALVLSNTHVCSLAAATWGRERDAQRELLWQLERVQPQTAQHYHAEIALSERIETCSDTVSRLLQRFDYDRAIARARQCGDKRSEHVALISDGRFAEAARISVPKEPNLAALPKIDTAVAAGDWNQAAAIADAKIQALLQAPDDDGERDEDVHYERCLKELLLHHAGDVAALARLRTLNDEPQHGRRCRNMLFTVVPPEEQAIMVESVSDDLAWSLGLAPTPGFVGESPERALVQPSDIGVARVVYMVWLADSARDRMLAGPHGKNVDAYRWLAVARAYDEDSAAARALADLALASAPFADRMEEYERKDIVHLRAAIALRTAAIEPVNFVNPPDAPTELVEMVRDNWKHALGRLALRAGQPLDEELYFGPSDEYRAALEAAQKGDGRTLARSIGGRTGWWSAADVLAVLPRLTMGKAELVDALRHARQSWNQGGSLDHNYPFSLVGPAVDFRDAYRVAGATADAAVWQARYQRLDAVFSDRKRLTALLFAR